MIGILSTWVGMAMFWGIPQLGLAVLAFLAGRRHKLTGFWVLAAAAILSMFHRIALAVFMSPGTEPPRFFAALNFYPTLFIALVSFVGWVMLAFPRTRKSDHDA